MGPDIQLFDEQEAIIHTGASMFNRTSPAAESASQTATAYWQGSQEFVPVKPFAGANIAVIVKFGRPMRPRGHRAGSAARSVLAREVRVRRVLCCDSHSL
jgi:purine nucleoside phosphorylase